MRFRVLEESHLASPHTEADTGDSFDDLGSFDGETIDIYRSGRRGRSLKMYWVSDLESSASVLP
jgi:hypothetical protein